MAITLADLRGELGKEMVEQVKTDRNSLKNADQYKQFLKVVSSDKEFVDVKYSGSGPGPLQRVGEFQPMPELRMGHGHRKRFYQVKYKGRVTYSEETLQFHNTEVMARANMMLAEANPYLKNAMATGLLEYGHLAAASVPQLTGGIPIVDTIAADGQPLFGTHTFLDSDVTITNKSSAYLDVTAANISAARIEARRWDTANGVPMSGGIDFFLIPSTLEDKFRIALGSAKDPETANNAINPVSTHFKTGDIRINDWFTSTTDWYMRTMEENDFKMRVALASKITRDEVKEFGAFWIGDTCFFSLGAGYPLGYYKVTAG